MLNLTAKICEIYPDAITISAQELMMKSWGKIPNIIVDEPSYIDGRKSELCFYTKYDVNGVLTQDNKCMCIWWEDDGIEVRGNTEYLKIKKTKRIVLGNEDSYDLDDYTVVTTSFHKKEKVYEKRRKQIKDNAKSSAKGTSIELGVNAILKHYSTELYNYVDNGSNDFIVAMNGEKDATILSYLSGKLVIGQNADGTPIYYSMVIDAQGNTAELTIKMILTNLFNRWN